MNFLSSVSVIYKTLDVRFGTLGSYRDIDPKATVRLADIEVSATSFFIRNRAWHVIQTVKPCLHVRISKIISPGIF